MAPRPLLRSRRSQKKCPAPSLEDAGQIPGNDLLSRGLSPHYHRRCGVSLPGSEWDRVVPPRCGHQNPIPRPAATLTSNDPARRAVPLPDIHTEIHFFLLLWPINRPCRPESPKNRFRRNQANRMISTGKLNLLLNLHFQPINVVVSDDP